MPIPLERVNGPKPQPERQPELKYTYDPTPNQCNVVKGILQKATNFPFEIIDIVMDLAEYWACSIASMDYSVNANQHLPYLAIQNGDPGDAFLVSLGLPGEVIMLLLLILDASFGLSP